MSRWLTRACGATAGSPTAVTDDDPAATDADRRAVAAAAGTPHAAFLGPGRTPDGGRPVRYFTATAEPSGRGHGTVAAQAVRFTRTALGASLTPRARGAGRGGHGPVGRGDRRAAGHQRRDRTHVGRLPVALDAPDRACSSSSPTRRA
ncbi:PhzF family phenazine biosynthesis protein [Saccharothrix sp.]|uniref:PhzF family phenazine biosynthesis protein n=1 Tax=Saccharothrix sp. TaxID=1873460 RepID=UPI0028123A78|nr:PhzF family phenazine biosynthesis protein [Saccharothrix sp.]